MKKIISVVGARPNFMKVAPIHKAFVRYEMLDTRYETQDKSYSLKSHISNLKSNISHLKSEVSHLICHTGQHYDEKMSKSFFVDLELPEPDFYLGIGSGSHAEQTAKVMIEFEKILIQEKPDLVIVVGDVNSTIACSLTAVKLNIPVAHVEAGLRSFDKKMPEEINRILTDRISDYLFVTEKSGLENLKNEGVSGDKIFFVGNVMIDSLINYLPKACQSNIHKELNIEKGKYVLATLHRPTNVDDPEQLNRLIEMLNTISEKRKVIFPVHPRTRKNLEITSSNSPTLQFSNSVTLCDPVGYIDFLALIQEAQLVLTDSGGIQEETTYLGVQCITLRDTTERPVTVEIGTNYLLGYDLSKAQEAALDVLNGKIKKGTIPELWDGKASERIAEILISKMN